MKSSAYILLLLVVVLSGQLYGQPADGPASLIGSPESWEDLRARLAERRDLVQRSVETGTLPQYSEFKRKYVKPEHARIYRSFVKLNQKTGLLEYNGKTLRPLFAAYSQPRPGGGWTTNIPELDFDLLEKDFARMRQAGINVQSPLNWSELLNYDGTWKRVEKQPKGRGLPYFGYMFQIYDYFLYRAQAHGLYVNMESSLYLGLHPEVVPSHYRDKILLYDPLWEAAEEAYARILRYFSKRTVIVAFTIGEDLAFDHCLGEPKMLQEFKRYLRKKYGSVSNLRRVWAHGYDYADRSLWSKRDVDGREVLWPEYPFVEGAFDSWKSFDDVRLPVLDCYRSVDPPYFPLTDLPTYQENLLRDPIWIDFMEMKEEMLISRLNSLARSFRSADANHILHYSSAGDFGPSWQGVRCFVKGSLWFDVIGTGQHSSGLGPSELPQSATCRNYVQTVASCGPYIGTSGSHPKGLAFGETIGENPGEGAAAEYPWRLADVVGGGGAFFQGFHWSLIAGRTLDEPTEYGSAVSRLGEFLASIQDLPFARRNDAQVLILRNKHAANGMSAGYDFGNAMYLASILHQLHIAFDVLPDSDVAPGAFEQGKVNLSKYRFIFVPAQNQLLSSRTWQMLEDWISDPRYVGQRGLCLGLYQDQDNYFNPARPMDVHPAFERLAGVQRYSRRISAPGDVRLRYARFFGLARRGDEIVLQFPKNGEIGCFENLDNRLDTVLELGEGGPAVVIRNLVNGNPVYTCGFYLGMAYDPVWGLGTEQNPPDVLNLLYAGMLKLAGLEPFVDAPENVAVYLAADNSAILLKEQFGLATDMELGFKSSHGFVYGNVTTGADSQGNTLVRGFRIEPYGTLILRKAAGFSASGGEGVSWECRAAPEGGLECSLSGKGEVVVAFELNPNTIYSVRENGELAMVFTSGPDGGHQMAFHLGDGSKPALISVKPNRR